MVLLEGFHALKHALRFGAEVVAAVTADAARLAELVAELAPDLTGAMDSVEPISSEQLGSLAAHPPPTGVVAVARRPQVEVDRLLVDRSLGPIVFLEEPNHLGNVGAVVRVAAAAGAAAVLTTGDRDPWHPAALRGSAGLHFALAVERVGEAAFRGRPLVALDPAGDSLESAPVPADAVVAFGAERHGLGRPLLDRADRRVAIPMRSGVSSLNLATAVAVVLYHGRFEPLRPA